MTEQKTDGTNKAIAQMLLQANHELKRDDLKNELEKITQRQKEIETVLANDIPEVITKEDQGRITEAFIAQAMARLIVKLSTIFTSIENVRDALNREDIPVPAWFTEKYLKPADDRAGFIEQVHDKLYGIFRDDNTAYKWGACGLKLYRDGGFKSFEAWMNAYEWGNLEPYDHENVMRVTWALFGQIIKCEADKNTEKSI